MQVFEHLEDIPVNEPAIEAFGTFQSALRSTFWAIFALVELDMFSAIDGERGNEVRVVGELLFGAYMVRKHKHLVVVQKKEKTEGKRNGEERDAFACLCPCCSSLNHQPTMLFRLLSLFS